MNRNTILPPEFASLEGRVQYVQKKSAIEYSSSCPECGGTAHQSGEWPDRFFMRLDGKPRGWCRRCGLLWWPDGNHKQASLEDRQRWNAEELEREYQRKRENEESIARLQVEESWIGWHTGMGEYGRQLWQGRGIPDIWQDFWQLGYNKDYQAKVGDSLWPTDTLTIPVFAPKSWDVIQVRHRLLQLPPNGDRYRQTWQVPPALYNADPDTPLQQVVLVEGEIKAQIGLLSAMDLFSQTPDRSIAKLYGLNFVGIPTVTPNISLLADLKDAEEVIVCLDPDARYITPKIKETAEQRMVRMVKEAAPKARVRRMRLHDKVDDLILRQKLGGKWWANMLKQAVLV